MSTETLTLKKTHKPSERHKSDPNSSEESSQIRDLQDAFNSFRAEVKLQMKIIQGILKTRNEQVGVQKKLLEREEIRYNTLMRSWGLSIDNHPEILEEPEQDDNLENISYSDLLLSAEKIGTGQANDSLKDDQLLCEIKSDEDYQFPHEDTGAFSPSQVTEAHTDSAVIGIGMELSDEQLIEELAPRKHKRGKVSQPSEWAKEKNKVRRMLGQPYLSYGAKRKSKDGEKAVPSSAIIHARQLGKRCTSKKCRISRTARCSDIPESDRQEGFQNFWYNMNWDQKKEYICSLVDYVETTSQTTGPSSRRKGTFVYYLWVREEKFKVCKEMFLSSLGIGRHQYRGWVLKHFGGVPRKLSPEDSCEKGQEESEGDNGEDS